MSLRAKGKQRREVVHGATSARKQHGRAAVDFIRSSRPLLGERAFDDLVADFLARLPQRQRLARDGAAKVLDQ